MIVDKLDLIQNPLIPNTHITNLDYGLDRAIEYFKLYGIIEE